MILSEKFSLERIIRILRNSFLAASPITSLSLKDRHVFKFMLFAVLLILLTALVVVAFYLNHPKAEVLADTWSYLYAVDRIQTLGQVVNFWRLPGYPLLIVLIYTLIGQGNLVAVSAVQAMLFVLAVLELYVLITLVLGRIWIAFLICLLVGTNITLLSYIKPIMSEAMSLWLYVSLVLVVATFVYTLRARILWLAAIFTLLLFLTRPEWIYLPGPLFAFLLLVAAWRGKFRRLLPQALLLVVLLYAVLGGYISINATQNRFAGVTWIQNINALGKVLQYHMQDEAPSQYANISRTLDRYMAKGMLDPYPIIAHEPSLSRNNAALSGEFAQAVIEHHLGEFLVKSIPVFFSSLTDFHDESRVIPTGPFGRPLIRLQSEFHALYELNILFPLCALIWLLLLCWRGTRRLRMVQSMGAIVLLSLYGLIISTVGAYRGLDYMRIHIIFDPLLILVIWSTLLMGALLILQQGPGVLVRFFSHFFPHQQLDISTGMLFVTSLCVCGLIFFIVCLLFAPGLFSQIGVVFSLVMSAGSILRYFRPGKLKSTICLPTDKIGGKKNVPV